jgi:tellurite resistance protein
MDELFLSQEIAELFAAALFAVIRADQEIDPWEGRAVQSAMASLLPNVSIDIAEVLLIGVSAESFANAVRAANSSPYRGQSISSPAIIAKAFEMTAIRVAEADGNLGAQEERIIQRYVDALTSTTVAN